MNNLLQGTTPTITFDFSDSGLTVSSATKAELTVTSGNVTVTHALADMTVDSVNNTLSYHFTEAETLTFNSNYDAFYQIYVEVGGEIYGTIKAPCGIFQDIKGEAMA